MKIVSYRFNDEKDLDYSMVEMQNINLIVGYTGSGKTRFINTIFNLGIMVITERLYRGCWEIEIEVNKKRYKWFLNIKEEPDGVNLIDEEKFWIMNGEGSYELILSRNKDEFVYKNNTMPKLPRNITCLRLLQREEDISEIFKGFAKIKRRRFAGNELIFNASIQNIDMKHMEHIKNSNDLLFLSDDSITLNTQLFLLDNCFKNTFNKACDYFKQVFSSIEKIEFKIIGMFNVQTPVFHIKEKGMDNWVSISDLSSGMLKVLLIIVDILLLPKDGIYLVDEYENSLGVNAIDFFPDLILDEEINQIIISSHHPYLINKLPVDKWYVFHRKGSKVKIKYGDDIVKRLGKSKQQAFIKLMNDSFYNEGEE